MACLASSFVRLFPYSPPRGNVFAYSSSQASQARATFFHKKTGMKVTGPLMFSQHPAKRPILESLQQYMGTFPFLSLRETSYATYLCSLLQPLMFGIVSQNMRVTRYIGVSCLKLCQVVSIFSSQRECVCPFFVTKASLAQTAFFFTNEKRHRSNWATYVVSAPRKKAKTRTSESIYGHPCLFVFRGNCIHHV